jgi:hypothetical protein
LKNLAANTVGTDVRLAGFARNDSLTFLRKNNKQKLHVPWQMKFLTLIKTA